jgi:2-methylcitrate dehydratase
MTAKEHKQFTTDYFDPGKRAIGNAVTIVFQDGTSTERVKVDYPIGHRRRRVEGIPVLLDKFQKNLTTHYSEHQSKQIISACDKQNKLEAMPVDEFVDLWLTKDL